jgi:hypothetical protein
MDDPRGVRSLAARFGYAIRRAALEDDSLQQGNSSATLGNVSGSSKFAACLFRRDPKAATLGGLIMRPVLIGQWAN